MQIRIAIILVMITALAVIFGYWLGVILPSGDTSIGSIEKPDSVRAIGTIRSKFFLSIDDAPIALPPSVKGLAL